ncbi:fruit protein pKIWI501-like [Miscanthus floridulus]|uniref:fruit protein pKIWI501-like n=1 Tax=Miscanthus floridulus TaxID=154761 RepID=UPI003457FD67
MGQGTLDHLPDVRGTVLGASASSPAFLGGGGEDALGPTIAHPKVEATTLEARVLGKRAVSLVGSMVEVEQAAEVTQQPPRKHQAKVPALAPRKALKVSTSSTTQWVVEAQATIQRGAASARADPKEPVAQGEAVEAVTRQVGEEAPTPREAEALEPDEAEAPSIAEATKGEDEATEARASRTTEAEVAEARAPETTEAEVAEAGVGAVEPAA